MVAGAGVACCSVAELKQVVLTFPKRSLTEMNVKFNTRS